jgi:hypothetical protein
MLGRALSGCDRGEPGALGDEELRLLFQLAAGEAEGGLLRV